MRPALSISAHAVLPPELAKLEELARNLAWTWDQQAWRLFAAIDETLWERLNHNPIELLRLAEQSRLNTLAGDPAFLADLATVADRAPASTRPGQPRVAYFSAEFGLTESLPIYAGGLGILAGDHLKAASDRGLELAGVGLFYRQGYFRQAIDVDGRQEEHYPDNAPDSLPLEAVRDGRGGQLSLRLRYPGREVVLRVWRARVGSVPLYLIDTDFEPNEPADRELTRRLYGGDLDFRLRQEILLGMGGLRVLRALDLRPPVYHLNEGHAAFLAIERVRELMLERRLSFAQARLAAAAGLVFTTHTPVAAGNDAFPPSMLDHYFGDYYREMGIARAEFLAQGRLNPDDEAEPFSMTVLALRLCAASNAVSELHGVVARRMWHGIWPAIPVTTVPIQFVTNGVHLPSWTAPEMAASRRLGPDGLDDAELWARHESLRVRLIGFARARLVEQLERACAGPAELARAAQVLDPVCLTIGFARRFAGYKRATLLLSDPERLARLLGNPERPIQIIFAGKAHPHDEPGKELIRELIEIAQQPEFRSRVIFIHDYDLNVARHLVQGVDVWLNTPRRPLEASGTSGMKAVANGALHVSTLDGWWEEAFQPGLGWTIGDRRDYDDPVEQDAVDRESLFDLLETEVAPLFYDRDPEGLPAGWLAMMRASMATLPRRFSTERMLDEYNQRFYAPALALSERLAGEDAVPIRRLAAWLERIESAWAAVDVEDLRCDASRKAIGSPFQVEAKVYLAGLRSAEVAVDLLIGPLDQSGALVSPREIRLQPAGPVHRGRARYRSGALYLDTPGRQGLLVRVTPCHADLSRAQALSRARYGPKDD